MFELLLCFLSNLYIVFVTINIIVNFNFILLNFVSFGWF